MHNFVIIDGELKKYTGSDVEVEIPYGITSIGKFAFTLCPTVKNIIIPESVQSIADYAFCDCLNLTSIHIPQKTKSIGVGAFFGCRGLADEHGFVIIRDCLYDYVGTAQVLVLPDYITTISERAFYRCTNLISVEIPNGVRRIGYAAFLRCKNLETMRLPDSITEIENQAFSLCPKLKIYSRPGNFAHLYATQNNLPFGRF